MEQEYARTLPATFSTVVVKVGTALLTDERTHRLAQEKVERVVDGVVSLKEEGYNVLLVSSGAVAAGAEVLFNGARPETIPAKQAAASVGQIQLAHTYKEAFNDKGYRIGQVLLSEFVLRERVSYLNARNTLHELLVNGCIPVVNENDTITTDELQFGDNDFLGATVASLIEADLFIILTDIEGVYTSFNDVEKRRLLSVVLRVTNELFSEVTGKTTAFSKGGMHSKLKAMDVAMHAGITGVIASGKEPRVLRRIIEGEDIGTLFLPLKEGVSQRKKWLVSNVHHRPKGSIVIDEGACRALCDGKKSLLPSGITRVEGAFVKGDAVSIVDEQGDVIARGLVNYESGDVTRIMGKNTSEIAGILGTSDYEEVIHRDNLVVLVK